MGRNNKDYLYIKYISSIDADQKIRSLFDALSERNSSEYKSSKFEATYDDLSISQYYYQLYLENEKFHEYWDIHFSRETTEIEIEYECIDKENKSTRTHRINEELAIYLVNNNFVDNAVLNDKTYSKY